MAKIWIPKSWSGTNPPTSGTRVFVGGKGAGRAVYESLSTGQTKRCLQSNGRGSVFYGNVTIADPTQPSTSSDVNLGGVETIRIPFYVKTNVVQYGGGMIVNQNTNITTGYISDCETDSITRPIMYDSPPDSITIQPMSGHGWDSNPSDLSSIKKVSIKLTNGLYVVYFVTYSSGRAFTVDAFYTNINAEIARDAQAQMRQWIISQPNGYICLNKTR